ncbi:MAG: ABC transporter permease subunit [Lachnospiraceae bacterium]|nr:ABC transporter permease subunit [Lachnospiraceae bacterium]
MTYYVASELNKALHSKYARNIALGILIACLLANISMTTFRDILYGMSDGTFAYNLIMFAKGFFWLPYYCCIFIADMIFGPEYPDPRLRNKATIGLRRYQIYFGKLIASLISMVVYAMLACVLFLLVTALFQVHDGTINAAVVADFIKNVLIAMPMFCVGVSLGNMFLFCFPEKKQAYFWFFIVVVLFPRLVMLLATDNLRVGVMVAVRELLITPQFHSMQYYATLNIPKILISSVIYLAASSIIGCVRFQKKKF